MSLSRSALHALYRHMHLDGARWQYHRARLRMQGNRIVTRAGVTLYVDPSDIRAALLRATNGEFDSDAIALWRRVIASLDPTVVVDIGANYGDVTLSTRALNARIMHFFEPNPVVSQCLRSTLAGLGSSWPVSYLHAVAASDHHGTAQLRLGRTSGQSTLRAGIHTGRVLDVQTLRIADVLNLQPDDRVAFKIDVEGHERAALMGFLPALEGRRFLGVCEIEHADNATIAFLRESFEVSPCLDPVGRGTKPSRRNVILGPRH